MTRTRSRRFVFLRLLAGAVAVAPLLPSSPALAADSIPVTQVGLTPSEGTSTTAFSIDVPDGATCPGDSTHDGYRVNSYMVPASLDPTKIVYDGTGPTPYAYDSYADFRQPLYETSSNSYVSVQLADARTPGDPGPVVNLPEFDLAVYPPGLPPAGRYHLGIACTLLNEIVTVWDAQIEVVADTSKDPAQIHWTAVGAAPGGSDGDSNLPVAAVLAVAVLAGLAGLILLIRRRQPQQPTTKSMEDA